MSQGEKDAPRMKSFSFAQGHVLCPYCSHRAIPIKIDYTGVWYECKCVAWQQAYNEIQQSRER